MKGRRQAHSFLQYLREKRKTFLNSCLEKNVLWNKKIMTCEIFILWVCLHVWGLNTDSSSWQDIIDTQSINSHEVVHCVMFYFTSCWISFIFQQEWIAMVTRVPHQVGQAIRTVEIILELAVHFFMLIFIYTLMNTVFLTCAKIC
jgi:hypothetical protein